MRLKWSCDSVGRSASDGGDFVDAEAFDGVQDESFALGRFHIVQSGGDEAHHFIGADDLAQAWQRVGDDGSSAMASSG